jgi:hypothetical protein
MVFQEQSVKNIWTYGKAGNSRMEKSTYLSELHNLYPTITYEDLSESFRTDRLERELQMVQLSATMCSCIAILWVSLVSFAAIAICVACQWVFIVLFVVDFVIDSVRKRLHTP